MGIKSQVGSPGARSRSDQIAHRPSAGGTWTTVQAALDAVDAQAAGVNSVPTAHRDGVTDDTSIIQAAIDALGSIGGTVYLPPGVFSVQGTINLGLNVTLQGSGEGATILRARAVCNTPVIKADGKLNPRVRDLSIDIASGGAASGTAYGVYLCGNCFDARIERVTVTGLFRNFQVAGEEGFVSGTCQRVTFRACTSVGAGQFGYNVDDADTLLADDCYGRGAWLDGFKLRKKTKNVTVRGGAFTGNGVGWLTDPVNFAGDGMDAYAGGDNFTVDGTIFDGNYGNGITVKTGDLNQLDAANYGYVRNVRLLNINCRDNLVGHGAYLAENDPTDLAEPLLAHVTVVGGVFEGNKVNNIYLACRSATLNDCIIKKSQEHGIVIAPRALDVEINHAEVTACGQKTANTYSGISTDGVRVRINFCKFVGKDTDTVAVDADLTAAAVVMRHGVTVGTAAGKTYVNWPDGQHLASHTVSDAAIGVNTPGVCIVHQVRVGDPNTNGAYGTKGSIYVQELSTTDDSGPCIWIKTSGARNTPTSGWTPLIPFAPVAALPTATSVLRGLTLRLVGGVGANDTFHVCRKNTSEGFEWRQITVT